ncbi:MAG: LLM class flavin-dependent oxidoreductase [Alphaproteobacteria bacterium]
MELGMFMQPVHPPQRDYPQVLDEDREAILLADRLGFAEAWLGEHITATIEPVPAPLMLAASLVHQTQRIKFGTAVMCLPQFHPIHIASFAAMFDNLSKGRFMMGIGPGSLTSDVEIFEIMDPIERNKMVQDSIEMVLKIWAGDPPYDIQGKYWSMKMTDTSRDEWGVGRVPKPLQKPHPPLALTCATPNSKTARIAGERGWIPITGNFMHARIVATHLKEIVEGAESKGLRPDVSAWRVARTILVTESQQEADDHLADPEGGLAYYYEYVMSSFKRRNAYFMLKADEREPDEMMTPLRAVANVAVAGTPGRVLDRLIAFREQVGPFGTLLMTAHDWDKPALWTTSMRLLAEQVLPRFRQHCAATDAAA